MTTQTMTKTERGPYRADQVGSLLRPQELKDARAKREKGEITAEALTALEDKLIREAVRKQEDVGIKAVTDGDFRRGSWSNDFLRRINGVEINVVVGEGAEQVPVGGIRRNWKLPTPVTVGKLSLPKGGIQTKDFNFLKSVTKRTPKVCIPSPSMLHFRGGREGVDKTAYPDMAQFFADASKVWADEIATLAAAGCRYVQLDDTNLAYLCDDVLRARVRELGEDPDKLPSLYAKMINDAIKNRPADMTVGIHLCRGNSVSRGMAEGGYEPVAEALFNEIKVDGFFLEYDSERAGDFKPLRFVPKGPRVVLGVMSSKFGELESADELKTRLEEASKFVPMDQICLSPQCGFASHTAGNVLSEEQQWAKLRRVVEVASDLWGYTPD